MNESNASAIAKAAPPTSQLASTGWEKDITFFVACYNEEENIVDTLDTLTAALAESDCTWEIIVVDDGSTDRSAEIILRYLDEHQGLPIYCKVNKKNKGLAQSFVDAAFLGRGKYYRLICGDNAEPKETFVTILKHLGEADILIPYQLECKGKSLSRRTLSKVYTWLINTLSGYRIRYYNGLAVHLRYNVMRWHTDSRGFGFQADLITRLLDEGFSYVEIPVMARERTKGQAKAINWRNFFSVGHTLLEVFIRRLARGRRRQK
jgi:glycosyltransferase involved in cell wall biosynthesis